YPEEPREALLARVPHLDPDEQILYVKAEGCGRGWTGALRVKVVGADGTVYRHVTFHPPDSEEDIHAHRWRSSVWFEP
ncbi:MAG TPA: hypothetical protein VEJ18_06995, partial [Planctomycetota bacterium]|nr:hypothetical protein [Planctomycetota bacterium]